jgi:hypothetical protein
VTAIRSANGEELTGETVSMIRGAIEPRGCLSGRHATFRVRFAPHVLGRDERGRYVVVASEYGGLTIGGTRWMHLMADRLRELQPNGDPRRTGRVESRRQFKLAQVVAAADPSWMRTANKR